MMRFSNLVPGIVGAALAAGLIVVPSHAEGEQKAKEHLGWADAAELSAVLTSGNSEGSSFAINNKLTHAWENADLEIAAGLLRAESTTRVLTFAPGNVVEDSLTSTTAERYFTEGKYSRQLTGRLNWYVLAGWFKNELAGFDSVWTGGGGLGVTVVESPQDKLVLGAGVAYTRETLISDEQETFGDLRGFAGYERKLNEQAKLQTSLELLQNLDNTDDLRLNYIAAVTANLSARMALKLSYRLQFDNDPVHVEVADPAGHDEPALFTFDEVDQLLTAAIVVNF